TMKRAVRDHPLGIRDKMRNKRIACKRSAFERPYAVIKNILKSGHLLVTTTLRTHTKNLFSCFCYNLIQLNNLQKN
ncbi:MAG: IS5/IS1182 family transposase, partial [Methanobacterium sp.]